MKRLIAVIMTMTLLLCSMTALAEADSASAGTRVNSMIDEGSFVIQIDVGEDMNWVADDMAQDDSVVQLAYADILEDTFVARYDPTGDGEVSVDVRHYSGIACDRVLTWDLRVADGAVQEVIGGGETLPAADEDLDPSLSGEWLEAETQFTQMTIEKNPESGWDVEIASPLTHGAYVFKTTVYYDCEMNSFVYDKGKFWDVPITEEENPELGEAKIAGTTGRLAFTGDEENPRLSWYDDQLPEQEVLFERISGDYTYYSQIEEYVGTWAASDYILEIVHMDDDEALLNCIVTQYAGDHQGVRWIYDACSYDDVSNELSSLEIGRKLNCVFDDDNELVSNELIYDDGAAAFRLNDDGTLTWTDFKQTPGEKEVIFERADADEAEAAVAADGNSVYGYLGDETVEEQVVYDAEGVRITVTGLEIVRYAPVLELRIENASGKRLGFSLAESALNDWMWDASLCTYEKNGGDPDDDVYNEEINLFVEDGETLDCGLGFANEYYYEPCGITGFGEIGFALSAYDPDTGDTVFDTPVINVETSLGADIPGLYRDVGTLAYEANDLRIVIVGLNSDEYRTNIQIYINNYSDVPVVISAESCSVNDVETEAWFGAQVSPGRQCLAEMGFDDITEIGKLAVAFRVEEYTQEYTENPTVIGISDVVEVEF